jgi:hypothetical protein
VSRPKELTNQLVVRIDEKTRKALEADAEASGRTVAQSVRFIISRAMRQTWKHQTHVLACGHPDTQPKVWHSDDQDSTVCATCCTQCNGTETRSGAVCREEDT